MHTDENPFPCNQCPKAFSRGGVLKTQLKIQTGEKPYPCNQCHNAFSDEGHLKAHLRTHSSKNQVKIA